MTTQQTYENYKNRCVHITKIEKQQNLKTAFKHTSDLSIASFVYDSVFEYNERNEQSPLDCLQLTDVL